MLKSTMIVQQLLRSFLYFIGNLNCISIGPKAILEINVTEKPNGMK